MIRQQKSAAGGRRATLGGLLHNDVGAEGGLTAPRPVLEVSLAPPAQELALVVSALSRLRAEMLSQCRLLYHNPRRSRSLVTTPRTALGVAGGHAKVEWPASGF